MKTFKSLTFIMFFSCLLLNTIYAQTSIPAGDVYGTWTKENSPYRITGDINIPAGQKLTIEPGVIVDFDGYYRLNVYGQMDAIGAAGDTIRFTRVTNDVSMLPDTVGMADTTNISGKWRGIDFYKNFIDSSSMVYCIVEFINTVDNSVESEDSLKAPVDIQESSTVKMERSVFRNNYATNCGAIRCRGTIFMDECIIKDNVAYGSQKVSFMSTAGGVRIQWSDNSHIKNSSFLRNKAYSGGAAGAIQINICDPLIMNNFISNNISYPENIVSAGGILSIQANPIIIQNLIVNNEGRSSAGAIYFQWGGGRLINNTICNNNATKTTSAGIYFEGPSGIIATNNILYGNEGNSQLAQIYIGYESSLPIFKYNLIGSGIEEVKGVDNGAISPSDNFFGDPSFINPTSSPGIGQSSLEEDWYLTENSQLIDIGSPEQIDEYEIEYDKSGYRRINYGYVDLGCFEYRLGSYEPSSSIDVPEVWRADTIHITTDITLNAKVHVFPGTVVLYNGNHDIIVKDSLYIIGTEKAPILFTINDTSGFADADSPDGGWGHFYLRSYYPKRFKHCIFEYGKVYNDADKRGLFYGSVYGNTIFENCEFRNCYGINAGIVYAFSSSNIKVIDNTFYNNRVTLTNRTCAIIELSGSNFTFQNNLIYNNTGDQWCTHLSGANVDVINNCYYHNKGSINFKCYNLNFVNNTMVQNTNSVSLWGGDNANIINSIVQDLNISQDDYSILNSYVPAHICNGQCSDILSEMPVFKKPLGFSGPGPYEMISKADYSLSSISPGIDFGTLDTSGLNLTLPDISGNPRINNNRIDIGAYEHQGGLPVISKQPVGGSFCVNDNHILMTDYENSDSALFQWTKDGLDIAGANNDSLVLDTITIDDEGNYYCTVSNAYGPVTSSSVLLKVIAPPEIFVQPENMWLEPGKQVNLKVSYAGTEPFSFKWEKDGQEIPGGTLPEYKFTPVDSTREGSYQFTITNYCGSVSTEPVNLFLAPQICMVTVDPLTGNNLVIWEKISKAPIEAYHIYRESEAAGIYDLMGTVSYEDLSIFVDSTADPTVQAYIYKITGVDTSGYETDLDLCKPHKTIHLLVSTNPELNTTQLEWDKYYGFDYQTYVIYRSATTANFSPVHYMASSLSSWTDPDPLGEVTFYRISVEKPDPCFPTGASKKAETGPYSHSMSNIEDNRLQAGQSPPDTIMLTNSGIDENNGYGMLIGRLKTTDADTLDTHTYSFVSGDGDDDNISFTILGDMLLAAEIFDYETKNIYSIRVRCIDKGNLTRDEVLTIYINDVVETGVVDYHSSNRIQIYPNPFNNSTTLLFNNPEGCSYSLYIMDLSGKLVRIVDNINSSRYVFEKGDMKEGFYFIELRGPEIYKGKLIVR